MTTTTWPRSAFIGFERVFEELERARIDVHLRRDCIASSEARPVLLVGRPVVSNLAVALVVAPPPVGLVDPAV